MVLEGPRRSRQVRLKRDEPLIELCVKKGRWCAYMNIRTKDGRRFSRAGNELAEERPNNAASESSKKAASQTDVDEKLSDV